MTHPPYENDEASYGQVPGDNNVIVAEFELQKEGADKLRYREIYPGGAVGSFYLSRLAAHYRWGGRKPQRIRITVEEMIS